MDDEPDDPSYPVLWDSAQNWSKDRTDLEARMNVILNVDGKGMYIDGVEADKLRVSHHLEQPFPLCSAVTTADFGPQEDMSDSDYDGTTMPFLAGGLHKDGDRDPIMSDVVEYWRLHKKANVSLRNEGCIPRHHGRGNKMGRASLLSTVRDQSVTHLPYLSYQLKSVLPLVDFLARKHVFRGWDTMHNWLYGGGCVAVLARAGHLVHLRGDAVAVADLSSCDVGDACPLSVHGEEAYLLDWPATEPVLQIQGADSQHAALTVRGQWAARYYQLAGGRLTLADVGRAKRPLSAVACAPALAGRWAYLDAAGRLVVRDAASGGAVVRRPQLPDVERALGWFGLHWGQDESVLQAASWERLYTVDLRAPKPTVSFHLPACGALFEPGDRLHAVRGSARRDRLTLLTSSRHLVALDSRRPGAPWLRSRLTVPQAPLYLDGAAWRAGTEAVFVAAQADAHVQCLVYDWAAGAELGASRLLGCSRPPLEAAGAPGAEVARRLALPLAGLAAQRRRGTGRLQLYTANACGDVFVHPLAAAATPAGSGRVESAPRRRRKCRKLVTSWSGRVEQQRLEKSRAAPLPCHGVGRWDGDLADLLATPPEEPMPEPEPEPVPSDSGQETEVGRSPSGAGGASSTDVTTPPASDVEELLIQWEEADAAQSAPPLTVTQELQASALSIAGSRRRSRVPRWQSRRRRRTSEGTRPDGAAPAADLVTPARRPPAAHAAATFTKFNLDLFDD